MEDKKIDVLMNEMTAIRNEINTTKETIHSILNFFFVLTSAEASLFVTALNSSINFNNYYVRFLILVIPTIFMCLSVYHSECVMRIHTYIKYVDVNIRDKLHEILGEPLLNDKSKIPTKNIFGVFKKSPLEAKFGYLSKLGLKVISMILPVMFYIYMHKQYNLDVTVLEYIMISIDIVFIVTLFFMQHD